MTILYELNTKYNNIELKIKIFAHYFLRKISGSTVFMDMFIFIGIEMFVFVRVCVCVLLMRLFNIRTIQNMHGDYVFMCCIDEAAVVTRIRFVDLGNE